MIRQFELVESVKKYDPQADEDLLNRAYVFSMKAHGQQKRASGDPYFTHPLEVAGILTKLKLDTATIVTALLHDTVEDTLATIEEIEEIFGKEVAFLVDGVTKLTHIEALSDQAKQAEKFRKLLLAMSADIRVLLLKLADRLHNMQTLNYISSEEKRRRIAKETMDIYVPLAERIGLRDIKEQLEDLAFAEINPDARNSILSRLTFLRNTPEDHIIPILEEIKQVLLDNGLNAVVSGREKTPYSIWSKMQRKHMLFEQMSDIIAFRVVLETIPQCYQALGILHITYPVISELFKDYISIPKQNNYRSLHTTIIGPFQRRIEVQIRTSEMDEVCELGVAAHWQYKQGYNPDGENYRWLRGLLEILEHTSNPEEFLEHTRLEMFQDQVFCFTPKGDLINLPKGATPIDFAYAVHSQIGNTCVGVRINGRMMPLRTPLENGDQVEILTAKSQTPSPNWERFVITGKARSSIRRFIRMQKHGEFAKLGKSILQKVFRHAHHALSEKMLESHLASLGCSALEDMYAMVGEGQMTGMDVLRHLYPLDALNAQDADPQKPLSPAFMKKESAIQIDGLIPGMAIHFASCCHPLPGDKIEGVVTTGKGVTIHTHDCDMLKTFEHEPERLLEVSWAPFQKDKYVGRIHLILVNQPGALATLTTLIAKAGANILNVKVHSRAEDFYEFLVDLEVPHANDLNEIMASLRMSSWVFSVERRAGG